MTNYKNAFNTLMFGYGMLNELSSAHEGPTNEDLKEALREAQKIEATIKKLDKGEKSLHIAVLHHPLQGCWLTPVTTYDEYPVNKAVVTHIGAIGLEPIRIPSKDPSASTPAPDDELTVRLSKCPGGLSVSFSTRHSRVMSEPFEDGKPYHLELDIQDAMESWSFVLSEALSTSKLLSKTS